MFRCTSCKQVDNFSLMLSENYDGPGVFRQDVNEHGEIIINIDGFEFIPDLSFMNSHAVCKFCGAIHCFEYYFDNIKKDKTCNKNHSLEADIDIDKNPGKKKKK